MKRLIIVASLAILAAGCQKTEIRNEVQTPIGFDTEVGKQTRAIASSTTYLETQPFGVFAYGHQNETATTVMNNVEVSYTPASGSGETATTAKWAATGTTKYYWPNDPNTKINFYAYSPAHVASGTQSTANLANHQKLNGTLAHREVAGTNAGTEPAGFSLTDYVHSNMYVDFMVGRPVLGAKYSDQDGENGNVSGLTSVPMSFNHEMTQIIFNVKTSEEYSGITFTVQSIVLNNVGNTATYTNSALGQSYTDTDSKFTKGAWGDPTATNTTGYTVFPAKKISESAPDGAPGLIADEAAFAVTNSEVLATTPVTMIPQSFTDTTPQSFIITYHIKGTGVAEETVQKTVNFKTDSHTAWAQNTKVTYTVVIGLNEITFAPSVVDWDTATESYTFAQ